MDEKSDQILEHIETQRNQLGANLNELETRVRRTADWRTHFDDNPMLILAGALGGGILLGAMVGGSKSRSSSSNYTSSRHIRSTVTSGLVNTGSATYLQKQRASETIDNIKAAVIAFPGFDSYVREAQSNRSTSHFSSAGEYNQGDYKQGSGGAFGSVQQTEGEGEGVNYSQNDGRQHSSHDPSQRNYSTERTYGNS